MAKVEYTPKSLIENKLLAALEEPGNVAIVLTEYELKLVIDGLGELGTGPHVTGMIADLEKLLAGAFPK